MIPNILLENCLWKGKHAESGRNLLIWRSARADQQSTINNWESQEISTDLPFPDFLARKSRLKGGSKLYRECLIQNWNIRFLPKSECLHCTVLSNMEFIMIVGQFGSIWRHGNQNIAKGTADPRVEFRSQILRQILIKFQFQNLDLALTSKSQPNISISTNSKIQLCNLKQTSTSAS